jgi:DNA-binding HxlR family transcriptional regulator
MPLEKAQLDVFNPTCVARKAIDRIADRWTILVFLALKKGTLRFSELKRALRGVSQKMLTQTLRNLEREGLVDREVIATVPVTVKYTLTPMGRSLLGIVQDLEVWAYKHAMQMHLSARRADKADAKELAELQDLIAPSRKVSSALYEPEQN